MASATPVTTPTASSFTPVCHARLAFEKLIWNSRGMVMCFREFHQGDVMGLLQRQIFV